jgi:tape measure domain-containing protein
VKKGMEISDTYTNIASKLSLITQNAKELSGLQNQIFAAADRARGSYTGMADTVGKLGITSGKQFGSNQNIVKFTETMQKMFKIGGTPVANQAGAMLQLQQAIGLGRLQGQDLRILAEDAPLVETAIAKYMGKSVGDIRQLGQEGKITSEVLINSILKYSGTVDQQMGKMKYTWGDYWNKIKNGAMQAFGGTFSNESSLLGSANFQNMINGIIASFSVLANVANGALTGLANVGGFIAQNWSIISPVVLSAAVALTVYYGSTMLAAAGTAALTAAKMLAVPIYALFTGATMADTAAQWGLNAALYACPLTWVLIAIIAVIGAVYLAVAIVDQVTGQTISATGVIAGVVWMLVGTVYNAFAIIWNVVAAVVNFLNHAFQNPIASIEALFLDLAATVANVFANIAQTIQGVLNRIPGVKVDMTSGLKGFQNYAEKKSATIKSAAGLKDIMPTMKISPLSDWGKQGYKFGQGIDTSVKGWVNKLGNLGKMPSIPKIQTPSIPKVPSTSKIPGTTSNPATVKGTGADGTVKVNIADQDLQYLRDLAEKQYINKFSTAVLSPKLSVSFSGNVGDKNDQQQIYSTIGKMMREEMATEAEGLYPI